MNERESHTFSVNESYQSWVWEAWNHIRTIFLYSFLHTPFMAILFPAEVMCCPGSLWTSWWKAWLKLCTISVLVSLFVCQESQWGLINKVGERDCGLGEGSEGLTAGTLETKHWDYNLDSTYHLQTEHPREVTWLPLSPFLICRLVTVVCISQGWGIERVRSYVKPGSWDGFAAFSMAFAKKIFSTYIIY